MNIFFAQKKLELNTLLAQYNLVMKKILRNVSINT